ncbi:hypothetical protein Ancab_013812 [Ancistrocladus abbreviatus]
MALLRWTVLESSENRLPPLVEPPPVVAVTNSYPRRSMETLVVVLAVITLVGVIAGIIARVCGGRHLGGNGENDIEGWVEKRCSSCIDGGVPEPPPPPPPPPAAAAAATAEPKQAADEAKK